MGHEAHDGEDNKSCEHAGAGIDAADDDGVPAEREGWGQEGWGWREGELVGRGYQGARRSSVPVSRATGVPPRPPPTRSGTGRSGQKVLAQRWVELTGQGRGVVSEGRGLGEAPVDVVVERVVAAESDQGSQAQPIGEKDLGSRIQPHL